MLSDYLSSCGLSIKEIEIYLKVFQYGPKTATQLSHISGIERTNCYKIISKLCEEGLVQTGEKNGVKQFRIEKTNSIKNYLENKKKKLEILSDKYDSVEFELQRLRHKPDSSLPKIRLFEQSHGLSSLYNTILDSIKEQGCSVIQFYGSDILETNGMQDSKTLSLVGEFYHNLGALGITVEQWKGSGMSLIETIQHSTAIQDLATLSHGSGSTQLRVIGSQLYVILFKDIPMGIKIESPELSYMIFAILQKR